MGRTKAVVMSLLVVTVVLVGSWFLARQVTQLTWSAFSPSLIELVDSPENKIPQRETVTVKSVVDGDTIKLEDGRTVRYIGIDTPETKHPTQAQECYGIQASQRNHELVVGRVVELEKDVSETDRYGRLLRYVWVQGKMVNEQLVMDGYALARSYPPDVKYQHQLRETEQRAQTAQLGLWKECADSTSK